MSPLLFSLDNITVSPRNVTYLYDRRVTFSTALGGFEFHHHVSTDYYSSHFSMQITGLSTLWSQQLWSLITRSLVVSRLASSCSGLLVAVSHSLCLHSQFETDWCELSSATGPALPASSDSVLSCCLGWAGGQVPRRLTRAGPEKLITCISFIITIITWRIDPDS